MAKYNDLHDNIYSPPLNLASELVGLITRKDIATSKHTSQMIYNVSHYVNPRGVGTTNTISRFVYCKGVLRTHTHKHTHTRGTKVAFFSLPNTGSFHFLRSFSFFLSISRAELAAIAAAIIHGYSHIATDSLTSMHQITKQLSHPNLHRHHIQGDVLQSIAKAIHQSPSPIHFCKIKS
jgi:hypothetical protein